jgi:hypothetical protein
MTASAAPAITHTTRDLKHFALFRSAVDKISDKNHAAIPVAKDTIVLAIVHFSQQAPQLLRMTMDIANDVVLTR